MIATQGLSVRIDGRTIISDIAFEAQPGQLTAIVGPNGSGKTTLLKAIIGDHAYDGEIRLNGLDARSLGPAAAAGLRTVLPQASVLAFPFTVREVVALGTTAGRPGILGQALGGLPEAALARVDLDGFGPRCYQDLSGGEQQRVQLARVLCQVWVPVLDTQPRYLLLDEPVSSLDIRHQLQVMAIARAFADAGGGVVAVLHDLNLAAMFADRIAIIAGGRLLTMGSPKEALTDDRLEAAFGCPLRVGSVPTAPVPFVLPQSLADWTSIVPAH
ncbi:heme ABC transporter ATP-binding protein [Arsenicitalea aurantiaca]|uniref:Heme ABC transporter ATP-binding protein n=1 Tax=Arsenicitalea aurantiaca TaxID=1783274 RepID=A0A433X8M0_9HYPH|nr:heme ABC transporter ATP-binding protein [Arsenicitalea aurantiaca]RUT30393.1 heme ABC transporter ATP-binding protein [Arsenicitalea aurantiaca]